MLWEKNTCSIFLVAERKKSSLVPWNWTAFATLDLQNKVPLEFFTAKQWFLWDLKGCSKLSNFHMPLSRKSEKLLSKHCISFTRWSLHWPTLLKGQHLGMSLLCVKRQMLSSISLFVRKAFFLWRSLLVPFLNVLFFQQYCFPVVSLLSFFSTWFQAPSLQIDDPWWNVFVNCLMP